MNPETALTSTARVTTERASGYLQQLCKHFGHKIPATFDAAAGHLTFPMGECDLAAADGVLTLRLTTADAEAMTRLQSVVGSHLERFAFREDLQILWQPA